MLLHLISAVSRSVISSQESADGVSRCDSQAYPTASPAGPEAPPVSRSALPESNSGSLTSDTLPPLLCASLRSAALQSSLASRLQQQLENTGSMIYSLNWKQKATPAQRQYCQRVASVPRIKEIAFSLARHSWTTPAASDNSRGGSGITENMTGSSLPQLAKMAAWPSPLAQNGTVNAYTDCEKIIRRKEAGRQQNLQDVVVLAAWPTPTANDCKGSGKTVIRRDGKDRTFDRLDYATEQGLAPWPTVTTTDNNQVLGQGAARSQAKRGTTLGGASRLASWATPTAAMKIRSAKFIANRAPAPHEMRYGPVRITASGHTLTGSAAGMGSSGQLNPAHSRWLMGFPEAWDAASPHHLHWQDVTALVASVDTATP